MDLSWRSGMLHLNYPGRGLRCVGLEGMTRVTALECARYFLTKPDREAGDDITHLKLQKLCYYAQAWHLALHNEPLFAGHIEAWTHGPVCVDLWHNYRDYGANPIPSPTPDEFDCEALAEEDRVFLDEVWNAYGVYTAKYLEGLTHQERPWLEARRSGRRDTVIAPDSMREYYASVTDR